MAIADRPGGVASPDRMAPGDAPPGGEVVYLFALVPVAGAAGLTAADFLATGGAGEPFAELILHRAGPIAALISRVPLADYCGADAEQHLANLAWLAPRTLHHAAVLRRAMACSPVYPVPFATLFAGCQSLSAFMLAHAQTLLEFFRAVSGMAEFELKASACLDSQPALEALARAAWPDWAQLTPGTRYLRLCRDRTGLVAARRPSLHDIAAGLAERLQPPATALRRLLLQPAPESGNGELVGRFALLVPSSGERALARRVEALADEAAGDGITLALSGPWPAFSFRPDLPRKPGPAGC